MILDPEGFILYHDCPYCKVNAPQRCIKPNGTVKADFHARRIDAGLRQYRQAQFEEVEKHWGDSSVTT